MPTAEDPGNRLPRAEGTGDGTDPHANGDEPPVIPAPGEVKDNDVAGSKHEEPETTSAEEPATNEPPPGDEPPQDPPPQDPPGGGGDDETPPIPSEEDVGC